MIDKINALRAELAALAASGDAVDVEALRIKYLDRKSVV